MPEVYSVRYGGDFINDPVYFPPTPEGEQAASDCATELEEDGFNTWIDLIDVPQEDYDAFIQED